eukprot:1866739-Alexandrium_andersonii.AAC.1
MHACPQLHPVLRRLVSSASQTLTNTTSLSNPSARVLIHLPTRLPADPARKRECAHKRFSQAQARSSGCW